MQLVRDLDIERRQKKSIFFAKRSRSQQHHLTGREQLQKVQAKIHVQRKGGSWYNFVTSSTLDTSNSGVNLAKA